MVQFQQTANELSHASLPAPLCDRGKRFSHHPLTPFEELLMAMYGELLHQHFQAEAVTACSNIVGAAEIFSLSAALLRKAMYTIMPDTPPWPDFQLLDVRDTHCDCAGEAAL